MLVLLLQGSPLRALSLKAVVTQQSDRIRQTMSLNRTMCPNPKTKLALEWWLSSLVLEWEIHSCSVEEADNKCQPVTHGRIMDSLSVSVDEDASEGPGAQGDLASPLTLDLLLQ